MRSTHLSSVVMLASIVVIAPPGATVAQAAQRPNKVKVAAVQILGYDKTDVPRPGYDPSGLIVDYINRAGADEAQLVVFPEYVLGRIAVPSPPTERIAASSRPCSAITWR